MQLVVSTSDRPWTLAPEPRPTTERPNLILTNPAQTWLGFGGCFNELGWDALSALDEPQRRHLLSLLFDPGHNDSCRFTFCRLPIGASDYALDWYSHNETGGDMAMARFTIDRDRRALIPYVKAALAIQPKLKFFASPWSPPTWMKDPPVYNYGTLVWTPENLRAYALYLLKFVQAYRQEGIDIVQLHPQNEPRADQKFPSCLWTAPQMRDFIRDYLKPLFREHNEPCELWLGTLNTDDFDGFFLPFSVDPAAREACAGVGLQWAGKGMIQRISQAFPWPDLPIMQTENECGDGKNTWAYAEYIFTLLHHYITNGVIAYIYWNMILPPGGKSTWGWPQNAMITIDKQARLPIFNPEFHLMRHFSRFVEPGAQRLATTDLWSGNAVAFRNPSGQLVVALHNPLDQPWRCVIRTDKSQLLATDLPAHSFATLTA